MRKTLTLDGTWRFMPDMRDAGIGQGWHRPGFPDRDWLAVPVPGAWDTYGKEFRGYEGVGWLRRAFQWDNTRSQVATLKFAGAGHHAEVWLNGRLLGSHDGSYVPFSLDARPALRRGKNMLAVRISNIFSDTTIPIRNTDWWKYGGITRPVVLTSADGPMICRTTVLAGGDPGAPLLHVRGRIAGSEHGQTLTASIGTISATVPVQSARFSLGLPGRGLPLWSPDSPRLVNVVLTLADRRRRILDRTVVRTGVRVIEWTGGKLALNGKPLWLKGVNHVEEYADWTCSPGPAAMRARILDMKRNLNANFYRAAHYPHHPGFLDRCDELGLLTAAEIPLCYHPELPDTTTAGTGMLDELFWNYAHHPSIIWWSTGNERPTDRPEVARGVEHLVRYAKSLDHTRPVTCVSNRGLSDKSLAAHDILVLNLYYGVWGGTCPVTTAGLARAARDLSRGLDVIHQAFPAKPVVIGEFGAPAFPVPGNVFGGERWQAEMFRTQLPVIASKKFVSGCAAWCYQDQRMGSYGKYPVGYLGTTQLEVFGLKGIDGRRKPAWGVVSRFFRQLYKRG
jgi:beta-glucuronidase